MSDKKEESTLNKTESYFNIKNVALIVTIFSSMFYLLNNYRFNHSSFYVKNGEDVKLIWFGRILLFLVWVFFLIGLCYLGYNFYEKYLKISDDDKKNETKPFITYIFRIIIAIIVLIFIFSSVPYYFAGAGAVWKGSLRTWDLSYAKSSASVGRDLSKMAENASGYDKDGFYWGNNKITGRLRKFFYSLPLIITNFFTGFNILPALLAIFNINKSLPILYLISQITSFNSFSIPTLISKKDDGYLAGGTSGEVRNPSNPIMFILSYIMIIPKKIIEWLGLSSFLSNNFDPVDWGIISTMNEDSSLNDIYNTLTKGGINIFWLNILLHSKIFSILNNELLSTENMGIYYLILLIIIIFFISYLVNQKTSEDYCTTPYEAGDMTIPCSDNFENGFTKLKQNLKNFIKYRNNTLKKNFEKIMPNDTSNNIESNSPNISKNLKSSQQTQQNQRTQQNQGTQGTQGNQQTQQNQRTQQNQGTQGTQVTQPTQGTQVAQPTKGTQQNQPTKGTQGTQETQGTQQIKISVSPRKDQVSKPPNIEPVEHASLAPPEPPSPPPPPSLAPPEPPSPPQDE
jgi:hypothetical protein